MFHSLFFLIQLLGACLLGGVLTIVMGIILCEITNRLVWLPIVIYFIIMWGAIIASRFVVINLSLTV